MRSAWAAPTRRTTSRLRCCSCAASSSPPDRSRPRALVLSNSPNVTARLTSGVLRRASRATITISSTQASPGQSTRGCSGRMEPRPRADSRRSRSERPIRSVSWPRFCRQGSLVCVLVDAAKLGAFGLRQWLQAGSDHLALHRRWDLRNRPRREAKGRNRRGRRCAPERRNAGDAAS